MNGTTPKSGTHALGDFTAGWRTIPISLLAIAIGVLAAYVALALLLLINLFTNMFFYQRWTTAFVSPAANTLGVLELFVPIAGAVIIGLMARFGSERIRGHGIPEALEAILIHGSRVEPRVALLKPLSAAISIGSGGPFGAEGPIIMTGGAFGSLVAQFFHFTSAERKTLLVAGAAAGMSATFAAPIASVLLAVELLLFEFKPRSVIPVALASGTAMLTRHFLLGAGPLFPVPSHAAFVGIAGLAGCVLVGLLTGALSALMTLSVYKAEDLFLKLPIHWMWWPTLGGLAIGIGGLIYPRALGVGYDTIGALLHGSLPSKEVLLLIAVKWTIWAVALGSGTSGGVLAPLLMIGSALGGLAGTILPNEGTGFWALVAMGAILGGTMRAPLTGVIFAVELTGDQGMLLPLLIATMVAFGFTVLVMRRSILTEKIARRGFHVTREYAIDPFEILFVRDVMDPLDLSAGSDGSMNDVAEWASDASVNRAHSGSHAASIGSVTAMADEPLRTAVQRMAETGRTRLPVIESNGSGRIVGSLSLDHVLTASQRHLEDERRRERPFTIEGTVGSIFRPIMRASRKSGS